MIWFYFLGVYILTGKTQPVCAHLYCDVICNKSSDHRIIINAIEMWRKEGFLNFFLNFTEVKLTNTNSIYARYTT